MRVRTRGGLEWKDLRLILALNPWAAAVGIEEDGRYQRYRNFTEGVLIIPQPTATRSKLYPDFPES